MFGLAIACLILGYAQAYWGLVNFRNGGAGPTFPQVLGLSQTLNVETTGNAPNGSGNATGQPATSNPSPAQVGVNV